MNVFIGISALLTLLVMVWLVRPLLRQPTGLGVSTEKLNAAIHRDQLHALEADLARGVISQQDFETSRDELQLRLLDDTESFEAIPNKRSVGFWTAKRTSVAVGLSLPVMALGLYLQLGTPEAINPIEAQNKNNEQLIQMLATLEARLRDNPDDSKGWVVLARSYKALERFQEANQAFEKAGNIVNTDVDLLLDHADVLGVLAGNNLAGKPKQMIEQALRLDPLNPMALMMDGVALYQSGDYEKAIARWEKLLDMLPPESGDAQQVQANINDAREKGGLTASASNVLPPVPAAAAAGMTPEMINQMVERLAERLKDNPDDLVGWARLARTYKVQNRLDEAIAAYAKTGKLLDTDPDLLIQYADALATRSKSLQGQPSELIGKALAIEPKHPMGLMMAGQAAYQSGNYAAAIGHWKNVLTVLPVNSPDTELVKSEIADAQLRMGAAVKP